MHRTGFATLPLHGGKAPHWLTIRMRKLAREISTIIINEHGSAKFLERLSDPFWFQAFGCVLGYDWHSSGVTTVLTGVLKTALSPEQHGIMVCGGKGKTSRKTPLEIVESAEKFGLSENKIESLVYSSKMAAKVDNTAVQAGYTLYHHAFFLSDKGAWAVVQQGMNPFNKVARRYHWLGEKTRQFIVEPHNAVVCDTRHERVLNMTSKLSEDCRKVSVDLAKEPSKKLMRISKNLGVRLYSNQRSLQRWLDGQNFCQVEFLDMPATINWKALSDAYETQPTNYEELLSINGVGPATVRGLALIAELVYGEKPSWSDPVKYSFCVGGKDGVPFPVNRESYDQIILILKDAVKVSKVGDTEKIRALQRLRVFVPSDAKNVLN